jgi:hypothetical protein
MQFEPLGGFPPLIRVEDIKTDESKKNIGSRGFSSANIINIKNIINKQKKPSIQTESGGSSYIENDIDFINTEKLLYNEPHQYEKIHYKEIK